MQKLLVRQVMSSPVIWIAPHTRLPAIKQLMRSKHVHRLPVVEGDTLVGIVTLGDVRNAYPSDVPTLVSDHPPYMLEYVRATTIMRSDVVTIAAEALMVHAAELMLRHKISGLPVMDGGRVVGMITKSDICRVVIEEASTIIIVGDMDRSSTLN